MSGFNLKSIKQVTSAKVAIKDPNGEPTGVVFEMAGPEHPDRKRIFFSEQRKHMRNYNKKGRTELPEPEDLEIQKRDNLAAFTLGWSGCVDDDDKPLPFSKQAALDMYSNPEMAWLVDQLSKALEDQELFIMRSVKA
jgi:hypothetical protein